MMARGAHLIKFCFSRISPEDLAGVPGVSLLEVRQPQARMMEMMMRLLLFDLKHSVCFVLGGGRC